jgi:hypothetical protein
MQAEIMGRFCTEQPAAADALQPPLRSGFQARLNPIVRPLGAGKFPLWETRGATVV